MQIRGHKSAHSLATGPVIADPSFHPRVDDDTSIILKYKYTPSFLHGLACLTTIAGMTFFLNFAYPSDGSQTMSLKWK